MGILDLLFYNFWITGIIIATAIWVAVDASNLNVQKGKLKGSFFDMGIVGWFFSSLLLWIIGFPAYLCKRPEYKRIKDSEGKAEAAITVDPAEQIKKLAELRQSGAITEDEFQAKKKELLARV